MMRCSCWSVCGACSRCRGSGRCSGAAAAPLVTLPCRPASPHLPPPVHLLSTPCLSTPCGLCSWVAGLGDGATTQPRALRLLEAILRVATGLGESLGAPAQSAMMPTEDLQLRWLGEQAADGTGFGIELDDDGLVTAAKGAAAAVGLRMGSLVVRVHGHPVRGKRAIMAQMRAAGARGVVKLSVRPPPPLATGASTGGSTLSVATPWAATPPCKEADDRVQVARVLATVHQGRSAPMASSAQAEVELARMAAGAAPYTDLPGAEETRRRFRVIAKIEGAGRTPPNLHDLSIYMAEPGLLPLPALPEGGGGGGGAPRAPRRHPVPAVQGAFVLSNVLTPRECRRVMAISEAVGYVPDQPSSRTAALAAATAAGLSDRAANFTWLADRQLLSGLFGRVEHLLPTSIGGGHLTGLNARWRFYRCHCLHVIGMPTGKPDLTEDSRCLETFVLNFSTMHAEQIQPRCSLPPAHRRRLACVRTSAAHHRRRRRHGP
jgi:hypothetical protein|eukprot:COSAG01_NODE_168_length_23206_cov_14.301467_4_plen_490_part_00